MNAEHQSRESNSLLTRNGRALRGELKCFKCGEKGHKQFECGRSNGNGRRRRDDSNDSRGGRRRSYDRRDRRRRSSSEYNL